MPEISRSDRVQGCLLGGALGDALGAPVEFLRLEEICARYPGRPGIDRMDEAYGVLAPITDDTQMTLFTAEGLIRASLRSSLQGVWDPTGVVAYAYLRWLDTQGYAGVKRRSEFATGADNRGWLVDVPGLRRCRAPGMTCLEGLKNWDFQPAQNQSKGCGTVMRSAPFGAFSEPWQTAWDCAEITHGHIEAKASAALFAAAISNLARGDSMGDALNKACDEDQEATNSSLLLREAMHLAESKVPADIAITALGEGWVADEALAIAAFCALRAGTDFREGVCLAVNHDGDSDSTGAICGNLLGTLVGVQALPQDWLAQLDQREVVAQVAEDICRVHEVLAVRETDRQEFERFWNRYPGA